MLLGILSAVLVLGVMGLIFGAALSIASGIFAVKEDERKPRILEALPGANCGGCGYAGCSAYADAIIENNAPVNLCPVGKQQCADQIDSIMGVESAKVKKMIANVRCRGNNEYANSKFNYYGINDCAAAARLLDGYMSCKYGCLGFGNCMRACPNNAISIGNGVAEINRDLCVGCGACADACPKHVIDILPADTAFLIKCSNHDKGALTRKECTAGCVGCRICEKNCPSGAITVIDNLAVVDYQKCINCGVCIKKCPSHIIRPA